MRSIVCVVVSFAHQSVSGHAYAPFTFCIIAVLNICFQFGRRLGYVIIHIVVVIIVILVVGAVAGYVQHDGR